LVRIENIFQGEGVQSENIAQFLQDLSIMKADYLNPCDGWSIPEQPALGYGSYFFFLYLKFIIIQNGYLGRFRQFISDMNKDTGGKPCIFGPLFGLYGHFHLPCRPFFNRPLDLILF
jgi:hypothetical protein